MERHWDNTLKQLLQQHPQAFIQWFLGEATFVKAIPEERANVQLKVDGLLEVVKDGAPMLLHIEFQTYPDAEMAERLLEYNVITRRQLRLPVRSCVIYLLGAGTVPKSPLYWGLPDGQKILDFHFDSIQLAHLTPQDVMQMGQPALLPLLPLTNGGTDRTVIERMFEALETDHTDLATIAFTLSSYVFSRNNQAELNWLLERFRRMHDLMRESPIFQLILKEGRDEGQLALSRQLLLKFVQKRFPELLPLAQQEAARIEQSGMLEDLILQVGLAQSADEAERYLRQQSAPEK